MKLLSLFFLVVSVNMYAQIVGSKIKYADIEVLKKATICIPAFEKPDEILLKILESGWSVTKYEIISAEEFQTAVKDENKYFLTAIKADYINPSYRGTANVIALFKGGAKNNDYFIEDLLMYLPIEEYWGALRPQVIPDNMEYSIRSFNLLLDMMNINSFNKIKDGTIGSQNPDYTKILEAKTLYVSFDKTVKWQVKEITAAFKKYPYKVELIDPTTFNEHLFGENCLKDGLFLVVGIDKATHPFIYDQAEKTIIYSGSYHRGKIDEREVSEIVSGTP